MMTPDEISKHCGISNDTVKSRRKKGILIGLKCNDKGDWLYFPPPSENLSIMKKSISRRLRAPGRPAPSSNTFLTSPERGFMLVRGGKMGFQNESGSVTGRSRKAISYKLLEGGTNGILQQTFARYRRL